MRGALLLSLFACLTPALAGAEPAHRLIAHRGGVVEDKFPDNSPAALHGAVARGYWGLEVDIRETKDGVLVVQHDADLRQNFGDARKIFESTWEELRPLRTTRAGQPLWRFEDLVKAAREAGLQLMLDSKDPHSPGFPQKMETILREHGMLGRCCVVGTGDAMRHFTGIAPVGWKFNSLKTRIETDPSAKERFFLFDEGRNLTADMIRWVQERGARIVVSINLQHYYDPATMAGKSREESLPVILAAARRQIEMFQSLGVTEFQIDSEFDRWF